MKTIKAMGMAAVLACGSWAAAPALADTDDATASQEQTRVVFETSMGDVTLELFAEQAPITVENFLFYVKSGFYEGTIFHRVIPGFMVQGGGFTVDMDRKKTRAPIKNEADNGLKNERGTLSMARTQAVDSATTQFFINVADNAFLDHGERDFGYAVFARVVEGMDVVDSITEVPTSQSGMHGDVPVKPIVITSTRVEEAD